MNALHPIAQKLAPCFDARPLSLEVASMPSHWWAPHLGPYHDGGWEIIALWAPRGDRTEQRSFGGALGPTEALAQSPCLEAVLNSFPAERNRVRLMRLNPGGHILRHSDPVHTIAPNLVRLHVPVMTHPQVRFMVDGQRIVMQQGETWHIDVRFEHEVENLGSAARVHLVMDLIRNPWLDSVLAAAVAVRTGSLKTYFLRELAATMERGSYNSEHVRPPAPPH